uniref:Uncharacterized protein n=1 Tax=Arundo donax TaxID=35708 RepID=A0A0A9BDQ7_ARUDO
MFSFSCLTKPSFLLHECNS